MNSGGFYRSGVMVLLAGALWCAARPQACGMVFYVSPSGSNAPPYTNWTQAARTIQVAINAAADGDTILVTNGTYSGVGMTNHGPCVVAINKRVWVRSVNGAGNTAISGGNSRRCVYLEAGAGIEGFTLHSGYAPTAGTGRNTTNSGGGVLCYRGGTVSNCIIRNNRCWMSGGGAYLWEGGELVQCVVTGNTANLIVAGVGSITGRLVRCSIINNRGSLNGGLIAGDGTVVENCLIAANSSTHAAGVSLGQARLANCTISGNVATYDYGGLCGIGPAQVDNCIVYYNQGRRQSDDLPDDLSPYTFSYCCLPKAVSGAGNITASPRLAGVANPHLLASSPCINVGNNALAPAAPDIDGEARIAGGAVDIGCDEYHAAAITGAVMVAIDPEASYVAVNVPIALRAQGVGKATSLRWGGTVSSNDETVLYAAWGSPGTYPVILSITNLEGGMSTQVLIQVGTGIHYVDPTGSQTPPYESWATAARNIQTAVTVAAHGGVVRIGAGRYYVTSQVVVTNYLRVEGAAGPALTTVDGSGITRAFHLNNARAVLAGVTLTNCYTNLSGGALYSIQHAMVTNCRFVRNVSRSSGGAVYSEWRGIFRNCEFTGNSATSMGGAVYCGSGGLLDNCVLVGNRSLSSGGGAYFSNHGHATNCVIRGNFANGSGGGLYFSGMATVETCQVEGNSANGSGGGVNAHTGLRLADCAFSNNFTTGPYHYGGGVYALEGGGIRRCRFIGNRATGNGGGILSLGPAAVADCRVEGNSAESSGGGMYLSQTSRVVECVILSNQATWSGGGMSLAMSSLASNCLVAGNQAGSSGGGLDLSYGSRACRTTISSNRAGSTGGGVYLSTSSSVANCFINENRATTHGGGAYLYQTSALVNCTLTRNSSDSMGGGVYCSGAGALRNCIIYYNEAPTNPEWRNSQTGMVYAYCCTTPHPGGGGHLTNAPWLAGARNPHLLRGSPCINAGDNAFAQGADIDHEPRISGGTVDMGCDEVIAGSLTGALQIAILAPDGTAAVQNTTLAFFSGVMGKATNLTWRVSTNGGTLQGTNWFEVRSAWTAPGTYEVRLDARNESGVAATSLWITIYGGWTNYVAPAGAHIPPYTTWANAATSLQAAINAACAGGCTLVTNGLYPVEDQVAIEKELRVQSVNGPGVTTVCGIYPARSNRCFYLNHAGAILAGFTLTNGGSWADNGGGIFCETAALVSNCICRGNRAYSGGGIYIRNGGTLTHSTLADNQAVYGGGGAIGYAGRVEYSVFRFNLASNGGGGLYISYTGDVRNCLFHGNTASNGGGFYGYRAGLIESCTLTENSASQGGGLYADAGGTAINCVVWGNPGGEWTNANGGLTFHYCATTPLPPGPGNLSQDPRLRAYAGLAYQLATNSPCIHAGTNLGWMAGAVDLEGRPRILQARVDLGASECIPWGLDSDGDGIPDYWEWGYARSATGLVAAADTDGDSDANLTEYRADTNPTNAASYFKALAITGTLGHVVFQSSPDCLYTLFGCARLPQQSWTNLPGLTRIAGTGALQSLADTNPATFRAYQLRVERP